MHYPKPRSRVMLGYSEESRPPAEASSLGDTGPSPSVKASRTGTEVSEEKHLK